MGNDYKDEKWADKAEIKPAEQFNHIAVPIEAEHVFGVNHAEPKPMHLNPMNTSSKNINDFANEQKKGAISQKKVQLPPKI